MWILLLTLILSPVLYYTFIYEAKSSAGNEGAENNPRTELESSSTKRAPTSKGKIDTSGSKKLQRKDAPQGSSDAGTYRKISDNHNNEDEKAEEPDKAETNHENSNDDKNSKENKLSDQLVEDKSEDSFDIPLKRIRRIDRGRDGSEEEISEISKKVPINKKSGERERENKKKESLKKEVSLEKEGNGSTGSDKPPNKGGKKLSLKLNSLVKRKNNNH